LPAPLKAWPSFTTCSTIRHNRLLETRPDLLEALYGEWVFRRMELDAQYGTGPLTKRVVIFSRVSGQLTCNVSGSYPHRPSRRATR
jgi:hypothetical protein